MTGIPQSGYGSWAAWRRRRRKQGHVTTFVAGRGAFEPEQEEWADRHRAHIRKPLNRIANLDAIARALAERLAG